MLLYRHPGKADSSDQPAPRLALCLQAACVRMPAAELLAVAPSALLPGLFAAYQHARPDVRKAAVYCLVHVWHTAGEG